MGTPAEDFDVPTQSPKCMQRKIVKCALNLHIGVDAAAVCHALPPPTVHNPHPSLAPKLFHFPIKMYGRKC